MSVILQAVGTQSVDAIADDEHIWSIKNTGSSSLIYSWEVGGEFGSLLVRAGAETLFYSQTLANISLYDNTGTLVTVVEEATHSAPLPYTLGESDDLIYGHDANDTLNLAGGNDTVDAGSGDDTITGGAGSDRFIITENGTDQDVITDFSTSSGDSLHASGFGTLTYADLSISQQGDDTLIDFGNGQTVLLESVDSTFFNATHISGLAAPAPGTGVLLEGEVDSTLEYSRITYRNVGDVMIADWNGDGTLDIVTQNGLYGEGVVWINGLTDVAQRISSGNSGDHEIIDFNGDGTLDLVTDSRGGAGWIDGSNPGQFNRITYNDVGNFRVGDINNDGTMDLVANMGAYANGTAIPGALWYEANGVAHRLTYNDLGDHFQIADIDDDGVVEVVSNDGSYQSGALISGLSYYEEDGTMIRHSYASDSDFIIGNFDYDAGTEVLMNDATYSSGAASQGPTVWQGGNQATRFTYNNLNLFGHGDVDADGVTDIIASGSSYQNGTLIHGILRYNLDGSFERINYFDVDLLLVKDWDNDGYDDLIVNGGYFGNGLVMVKLYQGSDDILNGTSYDDTLIGGAGNDILIGSTGDDRFEFGTGFEQDTITDFGAGSDLLVFNDITTVQSAADVLANAQISGSDTLITIEGHGTITLNNFVGLTAGDIEVN